MNYFTKEELKEITETLISNPSKETLKQLSDKYNQESAIDVLTQDTVVEPQSIDIPVSTVPENVQVNNIPDLNTQVSNETLVDNSQNNIPSFNIPQNNPINVQTTNIENEVPFNGNLWEPQMPDINNMMQTTNNFNNVDNSEASMPFNTGTNNQNMQPSSMFGQMEQNINNVA